MRAEPARRTTVAMTLSLLVLSACGGPDTLAVVDGDPVARAELDALHAGDVGPEEEAASLYLIILHRLLVAGAEREFGFVVDQAAVDAAFTRRTQGGEGRVDEFLADRGVTRARVLLEAELDVIRHELEVGFVRRGGPDIDMDAAYRQFVSVNGRTCLRVLAPTGPDVYDRLESLVDEGATVAEIEADLGDGLEHLDLGCASPVQHPPAVAPVAVDGEIGKPYLRRGSDGSVYVAIVTEREVATMDEVLEQVIQIAAERQGADVFNAWAFDLLRNAEVEIDPSVGTWAPTPDTDGVPTVVAP